MAGRTPVQEAAIEFVGSVSLRIVPVDSVACSWDPMFADVPAVLVLRFVKRMMLVGIVIVGKGHQIVGIAFVSGQLQTTFGLQSVIVPRQPFSGDFGIIDLASPPQEGFAGNGLGD